jgi:Lrp/AsnC family leucine-responsive transcriptional regulator
MQLAGARFRLQRNLRTGGAYGGIAPLGIDLIDRKILAELQADASLPNTELADRVGLTPAPCLRRVQRLVEDGVIQRYTIAMDNKRLGFGLSAMVEVTLAKHTTQSARAFLMAMQDKPEVVGCHMVTGDCDFILRIVAEDIESYRRLIWEDLHAIENVQKIRSSIILETVKDQTSPALAAPSGESGQ